MTYAYRIGTSHARCLPEWSVAVPEVDGQTVLRAQHHIPAGGTITVQVCPVEAHEASPNRLDLVIDRNVKVTCEARNVRDLRRALNAIGRLRKALDVETLTLVRVPAAAPCEAIGASGKWGRHQPSGSRQRSH